MLEIVSLRPRIISLGPRIGALGARARTTGAVLGSVLTIGVATGAESAPAAAIALCAPGPEYYAIELFTTKNIPGTGYATGTAEVAVSSDSPFTVGVTADGSYRYDLHLSLDRMRLPRSGRLVAWVTTPEIDQVVRIGALDEALTASGAVAWNRFIVVVTLEPADDTSATMWTGPIVLRGMSRSGMMHTMVGHGALQQENCAAYGYGS